MVQLSLPRGCSQDTALLRVQHPTAQGNVATVEMILLLSCVAGAEAFLKRRKRAAPRFVMNTLWW